MIKRVIVGCRSIEYEGTPQEILEYERAKEKKETVQYMPVIEIERRNMMRLRANEIAKGGLYKPHQQ